MIEVPAAVGHLVRGEPAERGTNRNSYRFVLVLLEPGIAAEGAVAVTTIAAGDGTA